MEKVFSSNYSETEKPNPAVKNQGYEEHCVTGEEKKKMNNPSNMICILD